MTFFNFLVFILFTWACYIQNSRMVSELQIIKITLACCLIPYISFGQVDINNHIIIDKKNVSFWIDFNENLDTTVVLN